MDRGDRGAESHRKKGGQYYKMGKFMPSPDVGQDFIHF